ncbi:DUF1819 family protein [Balneolales bacterium ANBcel1]|nr:DUF1819 family protein [Balneolales bacterium ANBcel1]
MASHSGNYRTLKSSPDRYRLSFTGADAMISAFSSLARFVTDQAALASNHGQDAGTMSHDQVQAVVRDSLNILDDARFGREILGREKGSTSIRQIRELRYRIRKLTGLQIAILAEGTHEEQKQITHLALLKSYGLYRDFVLQVLLEKARLFDFEVTDYDYHTFINHKSDSHPELELMAMSTARKIKQNMLRMLDQVGIIKKSKGTELKAVILIQSLEHRIEHAILKDNSALLAGFLIE